MLSWIKCDEGEPKGLAILGNIDPKRISTHAPEEVRDEEKRLKYLAKQTLQRAGDPLTVQVFNFLTSFNSDSETWYLSRYQEYSFIPILLTVLGDVEEDTPMKAVRKQIYREGGPSRKLNINRRRLFPNANGIPHDIRLQFTWSCIQDHRIAIGMYIPNRLIIISEISLIEKRRSSEDQAKNDLEAVRRRSKRVRISNPDSLALDTIG
ncbi:hypothetical protein C8J57DRAFT_1219176 [Mycena rebaudengoi]|nr:hypothetical protein C8J57DRAFT_1219176 [Mycena rebaudengoi]